MTSGFIGRLHLSRQICGPLVRARNARERCVGYANHRDRDAVIPLTPRSDPSIRPHVVLCSVTVSLTALEPNVFAAFSRRSTL